MNSVIISLQRRHENSEDPEGIDLHVNIWRIPAFKDKLEVDFGLMLPGYVESLKIFLPFELRKEKKWKDLGHILGENSDITRDLFNEDIETEAQDKSASGGAGRWLVRNRGNKTGRPLFELIELAEGDEDVTIRELKTKNGDTYTEIKITPGHYESGYPGIDRYIRFRVYAKKYEDVVKCQTVSRNFLQPETSVIALNDMTFNERRNISDVLMGEAENSAYRLATFRKAHVFFIARSNVNVENASPEKVDSRMLDSKIWGEYLPKDIANKDYISHHWKYKAGDNGVKESPVSFCLCRKIAGVLQSERNGQKSTTLSEFRLFFGSRYFKSSIRVILYISVTLLLGAVGSLVATCITECVRDDNEDDSSRKHIVLQIKEKPTAQEISAAPTPDKKK